MSEFQDSFVEIGAMWKTKSGKGLTGTLKQDLPAGTRFFIFENRSDNPKHPTHKIFVPKDAQQEQQKPDPLTTLTPEEKEEMPF